MIVALQCKVYMYMLLDSPQPNQQRNIFIYLLWLSYLSQYSGLNCHFEVFLRLPDHYFTGYVLLNLHGISARNHNFAAHNPMDFSACSPPIITRRGRPR